MDLRAVLPRSSVSLSVSFTLWPRPRFRSRDGSFTRTLRVPAFSDRRTLPASVRRLEPIRLRTLRDRTVDAESFAARSSSLTRRSTPRLALALSTLILAFGPRLSIRIARGPASRALPERSIVRIVHV